MGRIKLSVFTKKFNNAGISTLEQLMLELINLRIKSGWAKATLNAEYHCGMMITTLTEIDRSGAIRLIQIPTEYCERLNKFRDLFSSRLKKPIKKITFEITSKGAYEITLKEV